MAKLTYRLTSEGFAEFQKQLDALGPAGQAAFAKISATMPGFEDAAARAQQRAEAARKSLEDMARVDFRSLQASLDPVIASQQKLAEGRETVTTAQKLGIATDAEATSALSALEKQYGSATSGVSLFSRSLGAGTQLLAAFGVSMSIGAGVTFAKSVFDSTAALDNQAKTIGISTDALQAYRGAAAQSGADVSAVDTLLQRFTRSVGDAIGGNAKLLGSFSNLGLSIDDLAGTPDSVLAKAVQRLVDVKDVTERARLETELFGRSGQQIESMLKGWASPDIIADMKKLGVVIDAELVQRAAEADAKFQVFWMRVKSFAADALFSDAGAVRSDLGARMGLGYGETPASIKANAGIVDFYQKAAAPAAAEEQAQRIRNDQAKAMNDDLNKYYAESYDKFLDAKFKKDQDAADKRLKLAKDLADEIQSVEDASDQRYAEAQQGIIDEIAGLWDGYYAKRADEEQALVDQIDGLWDGYYQRQAEEQQSLIDEISDKWDSYYQHQAEAQQKAADDAIAQNKRAIDQLASDLTGLLSSLGIGGKAGASLGLALKALGANGSASGLTGVNNGPGLLDWLFGRGSSRSSGAASPGDISAEIPAGSPASGSNDAAGGSFLGKAAPYASAAIQGYQIGSLNLFGGNAQNSGIGGALGGAIGQVVGGPIGGLIGSALGSAIGGLFGPGPSNYRAQADFNGGLTGATFGGDKPNQNTSSLAQSAANAIISEIANFKTYGIDVTNPITSLSIGQRDKSYFSLASGGKQTVGTVGNADDLSAQALRAMLATAGGVSPTLSSVLSNKKFGSVSDLDAAVKFVTQVYDVTVAAKPAATQLETSMKALVQSFKDGSAQAKTLGLDVTAFTKGFAQQFDQDVKGQIEAIQDPLKYALDLWQRDAQARLDAAAAVGGDITQVTQLNNILRQQAIQQSVGGLQSGLTGLIQSFQYGGASAAAPDSQYFAALSDYNTAKTAALSSGNGSDISAFVTAAQNLTPIARGFLGTSERYGALSTDITTTAQRLNASLSAPPVVDLTPVVQATQQGSANIVDAVASTQSEVAGLREDIKTMNGFMQAAIRQIMGR